MALIDFLLNDTALVTPFKHQGSGTPVYGRGENRKCRIQRGANLEVTYKNPDGEIYQKVAKAVMFCTGEEIPPQSLVFHNSDEYTVISCSPKYGIGFSHLEVYLE